MTLVHVVVLFSPPHQTVSLAVTGRLPSALISPPCCPHLKAPG
jgi:hypothetical protein